MVHVKPVMMLPWIAQAFCAVTVPMKGTPSSDLGTRAMCSVLGAERRQMQMEQPQVRDFYRDSLTWLGSCVQSPPISVLP